MRKIWPALGLLSLVGCSSNPEPAEPKAVSSVPQSQPAPLVQPAPIVTTAPVLTPNPASTPITTSRPPAPDRDIVLQQIQKLQGAGPAADLEKAWQQADHRFAALISNGLYIPGVKSKAVPAILKQYGTRIICEMGDFNRTPEENQLWGLAIDYATRYNRLLLAKLKTGG